MNSCVGNPHKPFHDHLINGGKVWRRDPLNAVNEVLSTESFMGECAEIRRFGYSDLMIIPVEFEKHFYDYIQG